MARMSLFLAGIALLLAQHTATADDTIKAALGLVPNKSRRGEYLLSDKSMPFLLSVGYELVSTTTEAIDIAELAKLNIFSVTDYYLQNKKSGHIYKCAHERNTSYLSNIICWKFDPEPVSLSGIPQVLAGNPLIGEWVGHIYQNSTLVPIIINFKNDQMDVRFGARDDNKNVAYDLETTGIVTVHTLPDDNENIVKFIGSDDITIDLGQIYGTVFLKRKENSP